MLDTLYERDGKIDLRGILRDVLFFWVRKKSYFASKIALFTVFRERNDCTQTCNQWYINKLIYHCDRIIFIFACFYKVVSIVVDYKICNLKSEILQYINETPIERIVLNHLSVKFPSPSFIVHLFVKCRSCSFANI